MREREEQKVLLQEREPRLVVEVRQQPVYQDLPVYVDDPEEPRVYCLPRQVVEVRPHLPQERLEELQERPHLREVYPQPWLELHLE